MQRLTRSKTEVVLVIRPLSETEHVISGLEIVLLHEKALYERFSPSADWWNILIKRLTDEFLRHL